MNHDRNHAATLITAALLTGTLLAWTVPAHAANLPVDANGNPVYAEASINFDEGVSGQSSVEYTKNYKQGLDNDAFGWVSVDVNRPEGIIRMRTSMDMSEPDSLDAFDTSEAVANAIYRDQITLPTTDPNNENPPEYLNLTLGMDAKVEGTPQANDTSRAYTGTAMWALTVGDSGEFRRIDGSTPGANMVPLPKNDQGLLQRANVFIDPYRLSNVFVNDLLDNYIGPTDPPETFNASYEAELTIEIPLEKIEDGVAYYPFQIETRTIAGVASGGFAEADMGKSITLNALTLPDGSDPGNANFESGAGLVPEPSALALLAGPGVLMLLGRRRVARA